jgi:hypothetical protein
MSKKFYNLSTFNLIDCNKNNEAAGWFAENI